MCWSISSGRDRRTGWSSGQPESGGTADAQKRCSDPVRRLSSARRTRGPVSPVNGRYGRGRSTERLASLPGTAPCGRRGRCVVSRPPGSDRLRNVYRVRKELLHTSASVTAVRVGKRGSFSHSSAEGASRGCRRYGTAAVDRRDEQVCSQCVLHRGAIPGRGWGPPRILRRASLHGTGERRWDLDDTRTGNST